MVTFSRSRDKAGGTLLTWRMAFDSAVELAPYREFIMEANEQNFDRLQSYLDSLQLQD